MRSISEILVSPVEYLRYLAWRRNGAPTSEAAPPAAEEQALNQTLLGYPRNHIYQVRQNRIVPRFRLRRRARKIASLYPERLTSLLDVSCCRGYYVLEAALRKDRPRAAGIDVYEPFVQAATATSAAMGIANAKFHVAQLHEVAGNLDSFGGTFQTVILLGAYHYLYWGSSLCAASYGEHEKILQLLRSVCTERLILAGRLDIDALPRYLQEKARQSPAAKQYTTDGFLTAAKRFFHVQHAGRVGTQDVLVLQSR